MNQAAVTDWDEVPLFDSEQAEAAFWDENQVDLRLMERAASSGSESSDSVTITLRIDPRMLGRIKPLAQADAVGDGHFRCPQNRPSLAQKA